MINNLETANSIITVIFTLSVEVSYFTGVISGSFAKALMILGLVVLVIFAAKVIVSKFLID
jgi:hypothetical protein